MTVPIEPLESRRLMHTAFSTSISFQPLGVPRSPGYVTDYGSVYDVRRGGRSYGWSEDTQANAVDRNVVKDQKVDTLIAMQAGGRRSWSIGVENGLYEVYVLAGDPAATNDRMGITVEGKVVVSGTTRKSHRYLDGKVTVNVTDGKLTINNAKYAVNNKICYVGIQTTEETDENTLNIVAATPLAKETGRVVGKFTVTRGGDIDEAVTVPLSLTGTATNVVDYGRFGTKLTFAAGEASIDLKVRPEADTDNAEGDETVTVTLGATPGYTIVEPTATVIIQDAASTAHVTTLAWATKANRPVAASEIFGAAVGNTLYTFGGYVDNTYRPSKAAYAYDVATNTWSTKASLSVGLTHAAVASDDSSIYFAGGYPGTGTNGNQTFSTKNVYRYNVAANTYTALPDLPAARGGGAMALVGNVLYFMGGSDSSRNDVASVYRLDLANLAGGWVSKASLPAARNHPAAVAVGGLVYFLGGQTNQDANLTARTDLYRYDPATNAWTTRASLPGARSHITDATFVYDGKIVVLAGQSAYESALSSNVEYDPDTNAWTTIAALPAARFSGVGDMAGGKFVYTAGYTGGFKNNTYVGTLT